MDQEEPREDNNTEQASVPVIEEELVTGAHPVKTGSVRVRKEVERTRKIVEMPAVHDIVEVNRVPVGRVVAEMPRIREEGDRLVVPVVEEEMIVQKRLVLKEEIHIRRRRVEERIEKAITLEREQATIERLDADGNVIATSKPPGHERPGHERPGHERPALGKPKSLVK